MKSTSNSSSRIDLAEIRTRLSGKNGQSYWRSLDELAGTEEFRDLLLREFPTGASEWLTGLSRRDFLRVASASLAIAGMSACTKQPVQTILPYVKQPEQLVLGEPLHYATAMTLGGFGTGVLVKSREGHPIKIEGNPDHPSSLGASSIWMQASLLDLYDPDRSQAVAYKGEISSWSLFLADLHSCIREQKSSRGAGLRVLTGTVTSPTLVGQLLELLRLFPEARWHQFDPISRDNIREGARLAFGDVVETHLHLEAAAVILSLDSDFLYTHPERLRYTRDFTNARRVSAGSKKMNRLYVIEPTPSVTGAMADHRLPLTSGELELFARQLARKFGAPIKDDEQPLTFEQSRWLDALARDLQEHHGASAVIAGETQSPFVHYLSHFLNQALGNFGNTIMITQPAEPNPVNQLDSFAELVENMKAGRVDTLLILGGNPVYGAPVDFAFGEFLPRIRRSVHLGLHVDETAELCTWHIPQTHYLEAWGDVRAFDGTCSLIQPLIAPLYEGKSDCELVSALIRPQPLRSDYEIVREYWKNQNRWPDFERGWRKSLRDGIISGTALPNREVKFNANYFHSLPALTKVNPGILEINFRPDPGIWDGQFANNGWLQECPKPISKLTWDNALLISPILAQKRGLANGSVINIVLQHRRLPTPVWIQPGQAPQAVTLHLGHGRWRIGRVGLGVGCNAYALRSSAAFWNGNEVDFSRTIKTHRFAVTQTHHSLENPEREVYRAGTLQEFTGNPNFIRDSVEHPKEGQTLYEPNAYSYGGYKWGMSIDLNSCIGCNACLIACEVENNIPMVGKEQVGLGREMFWIRIDTYYKGSLDDPEYYHMPVPCMHCEHAPCELVCPVAATVHDHEGLNLQVYNRCVGTRFCSNNCPYKVRRFNFFQYANYQAKSLKPMYNPEVTVRWRGVMEKCTFCVQRISAARIAAEKENRRVVDGEIQTACQQACPAQAIVFGDLNDPQGRILRLKSLPLDYSMLGGLNTRPRTTYLAKLKNVNPDVPVSP